jgi:uncharacterized membrane protein
LAIASLVLAVIAFFGVFPLSLVTGEIYCTIVGRIVCSEYYYRSLMYLCYSSIAASILAIILGFISFHGSKEDDFSQIISQVAMALGIITILLAIFTRFMLFIGSVMLF